MISKMTERVLGFLANAFTMNFAITLGCAILLDPFAIISGSLALIGLISFILMTKRDFCIANSGSLGKTVKISNLKDITNKTYWHGCILALMLILITQGNPISYGLIMALGCIEAFMEDTTYMNPLFGALGYKIIKASDKIFIIRGFDLKDGDEVNYENTNKSVVRLYSDSCICNNDNRNE